MVVSRCENDMEVTQRSFAATLLNHVGMRLVGMIAAEQIPLTGIPRRRDLQESRDFAARQRPRASHR